MDAQADRMIATYPAAPTSVGLARRDVDTFARRGGLSELTRELVALAVSEAASNVVLHAYRGAPDPGSFDIDVLLQPEYLIVSVEDRGSGMRPHPESTGLGLGLGLIGTVAKAVAIEDRAPGLCLRMTFARG